MTVRFLHRELSIAVLQPADKFKALVKDPLTAALADSISLLGQLHEPLVRRGDAFTVLHGNRRIAAAIRLGKKTVLCKLVECTELEADALARQDRGVDSPDTSTALDNAIARVRREQRENPPKPRGGRPPGPGKAVREALAAAMGVSPKALEVAQERAKRAERAADEPKATLADLAPATIAMLGMEVDADFLKAVLAAHEYVATARQFAVQCQSGITRLLNSGTPYPQSRARRMRDMANELSRYIASQMPSSLCPWCKGVPQVMEKCAACTGVGIIVAQQEASVPRELRDETTPKVTHLGRYVEVAKL